MSTSLRPPGDGWELHISADASRASRERHLAARATALEYPPLQPRRITSRDLQVHRAVAHDLRDAEDFYKRIFSMDLLFRGGKLGQEDWATLPLDKGWEDAEAVGTELSMIALRRDDFVLALKAIASS